jgi:23S rRNA pseudouridine1911/1915/1917 synthase
MPDDHKKDYSKNNKNNQTLKRSPQRMLGRGLVLLYEDRDLVVVEKPAGLLSIAAGGEREKTAYRVLSEYFRKRGGGGRPAAVHRLDRDTSGVMIFAKDGRVKKTLMENWDDLIVRRLYVAVAEGDITPDGKAGGEGRIDAPLQEEGAGKNRGGRMVVREGGKPAATRWKLLEKGGGYSLLSLELETGRRNQIRAHLAYIGHPVAGDKKYGASTDPLKRLCLHAETISFRHPYDGKLMEFNSPVPKGFRSILLTPPSRNSYK